MPIEHVTNELISPYIPCARCGHPVRYENAVRITFRATYGYGHHPFDPNCRGDVDERRAIRQHRRLEF